MANVRFVLFEDSYIHRTEPCAARAFDKSEKRPSTKSALLGDQT